MDRDGIPVNHVRRGVLRRLRRTSCDSVRLTAGLAALLLVAWAVVYRVGGGVPTVDDESWVFASVADSRGLPFQSAPPKPSTTDECVPWPLELWLPALLPYLVRPATVVNCAAAANRKSDWVSAPRDGRFFLAADRRDAD